MTGLPQQVLNCDYHLAIPGVQTHVLDGRNLPALNSGVNVIVRELIDILLTYQPHARVHLMTQHADPYENHLAGIVERAELEDQAGRQDAGVDPHDVFLIVGKRIRRGTVTAWTQAETKRQQLMAPSRRDARVLCAISQHLGLEGRHGEVPATVHLVTRSVREALLAAYRAGLEQRAPEASTRFAEAGGTPPGEAAEGAEE